MLQAREEAAQKESLQKERERRKEERVKEQAKEREELDRHAPMRPKAAAAGLAVDELGRRKKPKAVGAARPKMQPADDMSEAETDADAGKSTRATPSTTGRGKA